MEKKRVKATYDEWVWLVALMKTVVKADESLPTNNSLLKIILQMSYEMLGEWERKFWERQATYAIKIPKSQIMLMNQFLYFIDTSDGYQVMMREVWWKKLGTHPLMLKE